MPRYVVLQHETPETHDRPSHWDLMLEAEGGLWTWALPDDPQLHRELVAERLPDHRAAYLEYEGPVSANRGQVRRVMQGRFSFTRISDEYIEIQVESGPLPSRLRLARQTVGQRWKVTLDEVK